MNLSDIIIVYLAFGAPVAAYKYLQDRNVERRISILTAVIVWLFWVPAAVRLGYRYFSNAYSDHDFVSKKILDSADGEFTELCEATKASLLSSGCGLSMHDVRETLERYVGLTVSLKSDDDSPTNGLRHALFDAVGEAEAELPTICLLRRNRRRLERHQTYARRDFLAVFEQLPRKGSSAMELGLRLASRLGDREAVSHLKLLIGTRGEVWNPEQKQLAPASTSSATTLSATTAVLTSE